jgi:superfamily II DNA or RNA helicase
MKDIAHPVHYTIERYNFMLERLSSLETEKTELLNELEALQRQEMQTQKTTAPSITISSDQKIAVFMSLFRGREDVFPKRWDNAKTGKSGYAPACHNEWVRGVCNKPQIKCGDCQNQAFIPISADVVRKHLAGDGQREHTIGVYPMLKDETCWFLAADFDKEHWQRDAAAFLETCRRNNVPASLERSRSGNDGHVWIFFEQPVAASEARKMYADQWAYLSSVRRISLAAVSAIVSKAAMRGRILGVRMPLEDEDEKPWMARPSRTRPDIPIEQKLPESVELVLGNQLYVAKADLPPAVINRLIRLAAFQNPEFYLAQAMRMSTFGKPRIIACAEDFPKYIGLPRGCADEAVQLLKSLGIKTRIDDKRNSGEVLDARFLGELLPEQKRAVKAMLAHETGVLAATTAFGKTVVAAHIIAERKTNTIVLVHRRQLMDQWIARLQTFLDVPAGQIGMIYGGKRKPTGIIDVALIQSLVKKDVVDDIIANYGQLVVDECHHLSAVSFEAVARAFNGKYVLGLTTTATRKDGHHPIIFMQCGAIRYKVDAKEQAALRPFTHQVITRPTTLQFILPNEQKPTINQLYAAVASDEARNQQIIADVQKCLQEKRNPLILTERKDHAALLTEQLSPFCKNVVVLVGGQAAKKRAEIAKQLASIPDDEERLIIATGRYIGEGFDDARLDTLFLAMPISWHGTLAQYAGRLHRLHHAKKQVIIYDYVDTAIPMLAKMAEKRVKGYERLGYALCKN